jgi:PAS domain S-box-containing protein
MTPHPLRVLLIEDQDDEALVTGALLERLPGGTPVTLERVGSAAEGLDALLARRHDVCLLDYMLGVDTGTELLRRVRAHAVRTPVILLTGKGSRDVDLEAMAAGASDYLMKGAIDPETLERALRYAVERHRAQEELLRSEERNRGMFDHLPLGLFRVTPAGEYLEANPALIRILEHPTLDVLRSKYARHCFVAPGDHARLLHTLEQFGEVTGFETSVRSPGDRLLRLRVSARFHRSPRGAVEYIEGAVEDLTGTPQLHELEEGAASFQALAEGAAIGLLRTDTHGQVRWANAAAVDSIGDPPEAILGAALWSFLHPDDQERVARAFEELQSGTRDRSTREVRLLSANGEGSPRRLTLMAVMGRAGDLRSILASLEGS